MYKYEKNLNNEQDIVISGWEKGIADSPYKGIGNIRNLNIKYYDGVAYVNYKRQACTITGGTLGNPLYATQSPAGIIYISDSNRQIFKQTAVNGSTFALLSGNANQPIDGIAFWNNYLIVFGGDVNGQIEICGDGTGDGGVTSSNWNTAAATTGVWPIKAPTLALSGTPAAGDTSATISSYTDGKGNSRAFWNGPTGIYNIGVISSGPVTQVVLASMTQGSADFTWTPALNFASSSANVFLFYNGNTLTSTGVSHQSLISANDGNLYFCNGANVGSFEVKPNQIFDKANMKTFIFNVAALSLPPTETSKWLTELRNQLVVLGQYKIYPWDRFSPQWQNPIPMDESLIKGINILNNLYIFAGVKGNIYISNGFNAQRFKKIPDYIASAGATGGPVDPAWFIGGVMQHRQKLCFQATAKNGQTGAVIFQGLFSLDLDTGALNMENQNSGGIAPAGLVTTGLLIDDNSLAINYDKYYSAYGATTNSIDFNDTTLYSSDEAIIETDLIPIGTAAQTKTFSSAEYKLDQPLQAGDTIAIYARQSLSDTYVQIGSTTTSTSVTPSGNTISNFLTPVTFEKWQWVQFKVVMSCNATSTASSFNRLREIRIR